MAQRLKISKAYERPLAEALTEYLFGPKKNLDQLDFAYPYIKYYVHERREKQTGRLLSKYDAEMRLFAAFWPPAASAQLLHIVGGAGSGKSTFLRYFFKYFLPHYERVAAHRAPEDRESFTHAQSFNRHILLYIDLRLREEQDIASEIFNSLGRSLHHVASRIGYDFGEKQKHYNQSWVRSQVTRLGAEVDGNRRKWYITCVVDNSDQLEEVEQKELAEIARAYLSPTLPRIDADCPVTVSDGRTLWRVIIPIRPETQRNLARVWEPFPNRDFFVLDPIDPDNFVETRAEFVRDQVANSRLHREKDLPRLHVDRDAGFLMWKPEDIANSLRDDLLAASKPEDTTVPKARSVLDLLVGDSARRRLNLLARTALSEVFHERRELGRIKQWKLPVSAIYFFDALIRGDKEVFDADSDPFILNLYGMGATPAYRPHSIFVGVHAVYLLCQDRDWNDVKRDLRRIGYPEKDLVECQIKLIGNELIRRLWDDQYVTEISYVKGHWEILDEPAYTDNMAVVCASNWGFPDKAQPTDHLDPSELLGGFTGSLWFMQELWKAEKALSVYLPDMVARCGNFPDFRASRAALNLPCVTRLIAQQYLHRMQELPKYDRPYEGIQSDLELWNDSVKNLKELQDSTRAPAILDARQS